MGKSGQLSGQFNYNTFLEILGGGAFPHVYFAKRSDDDNIIPFPKRFPNKKPSEILLDLTLTQDAIQALFKDFIDLLKLPAYNLEFSEVEVPTFNYKSRKYNCVKKKNAPVQQENPRCLIYIPKRFLLKRNNDVNGPLINQMYTDFTAYKPGSFIIVFSTIDQVDRSIRDIIHPEHSANTELIRRFVPWRDIKDLVSEDLEVRRKNLLADILGMSQSF